MGRKEVTGEEREQCRKEREQCRKERERKKRYIREGKNEKKEYILYLYRSD